MKKRTQHELNLIVYFNHRKEWSRQDDEQLQELSQTHLDADIARLIGRTIGSIWNRRQWLKQHSEESHQNEIHETIN